MVCAGNLGRSPALERILSSKGLKDINIHSRGVDVDQIAGFDYGAANLSELVESISTAIGLDLLNGEEKKDAQGVLDYFNTGGEGIKITPDFREKIEKLSRTSWDKIYDQDESFRDMALKERGYNPIGIMARTPKQLEYVVGPSNLIMAVSDDVRKKVDEMYKETPSADMPLIFSARDIIGESVEDPFLSGSEAYGIVTEQLERVAEGMSKYFSEIRH